MILPFWNSELYVEISSWFPFGKDYHPVSLNRFYDDTLHTISEACLDLEGEFFFMASPQTGCVGNLPRENFFKYSPDRFFSLGFLMTLGYSDLLERAVIASLTLPCVNYKLTAGITACSLWSNGVYEGSTRVIAVAGDEPFYDCTEYLKGFAGILEGFREAVKSSNNSYYAEKFGYKRFFVSWEKDSPTDLRVSEMISDFKFDGTKEIVGGANTEDFPPFIGAAVSVRNHDDE